MIYEVNTVVVIDVTAINMDNVETHTQLATGEYTLQPLSVLGSSYLINLCRHGCGFLSPSGGLQYIYIPTYVHKHTFIHISN